MMFECPVDAASAEVVSTCPLVGDATAVTVIVILVFAPSAITGFELNVDGVTKLLVLPVSLAVMVNVLFPHPPPVSLFVMDTV